MYSNKIFFSIIKNKKIMGYSNFKKNSQLKDEFGIIPIRKKLFDNNIKLVEPSEWLKTTLSYSSIVSSQNEKSKSETIVQPILLELVKENKDFISYFSGSNLDVDSEKGLNGECDFIITKNFGMVDISSPIFQIVEAKDHDIKLGIPQCAAQMYAAKLFNEKDNANIDCIYGCVTTGNMWRFLKLCGKELLIGEQIFYLNEVNKILGVFQTIIDTFK